MITCIVDFNSCLCYTTSYVLSLHLKHRQMSMLMVTNSRWIQWQSDFYQAEKEKPIFQKIIKGCLFYLETNEEVCWFTPVEALWCKNKAMSLWSSRKGKIFVELPSLQDWGQWLAAGFLDLHVLFLPCLCCDQQSNKCNTLHILSLVLETFWPPVDSEYDVHLLRSCTTKHS